MRRPRGLCDLVNLVVVCSEMTSCYCSLRVAAILVALVTRVSGFLPSAHSLALHRHVETAGRHADALMMGRKGRPKMPAGGNPGMGPQ